VKLEIDKPILGQFKVESDKPWNANFKIETDGPPPTRTQARVVAMPLDPVAAGQEACARIALVDVDGMLLNQNMTGLNSVGDNPVALFKEKLDAVASQPGVCAVVLRLNTPGGSVNASETMFQELQNFRARTKLPVIACVMDLAAGGGYYLAAGCDAIVAAPTSIVGGVGVIWNGYFTRPAMGVLNLQEQVLKSGNKIDMGTGLYQYDAKEARGVEALLKSMCEDYHKHFKTRLRQARPRLPETCDFADGEKADLLDGRVMTGAKAFSCGVVDRVGYIEDAITLARDVAKQPLARVELFHRSNDLAFSPYAITPNTPQSIASVPANVPGAERPKQPTFLFMWLPEPTADKIIGH
jgi:protease-4